MKQTAVEWLEQLLFDKLGKFTKGDIEDAKAMEKQQIMQTRQDIYHTGDLDNEQYYNKTFKSK